MATSWFEKAIEAGSVRANLRLGFIYAQEAFGQLDQNGQPDPALWQKSRTFFENAAVQNVRIVHSMCLLLESDEEIAAWFIQKATQGYADAQAMLGFMYGQSIVVGEDRQKATHWLEQAILQGHTGAKQYLDSLKDKGLHLPERWGICIPMSF